MTYLERALQDGQAEIVDEGKKQRIVYKAVDHSEHYSDPEEQVIPSCVLNRNSQMG